MGKLQTLFLITFFIFILHPPAPIHAYQAPDPSVNQYLNQNEKEPASPKEEPTRQTQDGTVSLWGLIGKAFLALLFILLLLYGLAWWVKKGRSVGTNEHFGVLASLWVSQNKSIQLVRIGSQLFLIGVGENITLLHHFEKEEELASILQSMHGSEEGLHRGRGIRLFESLSGHRRKDGERDSFKEELVRQLERLRRREGRKERNREEEDQDES